jgi:hypothetical protein
MHIKDVRRPRGYRDEGMGTHPLVTSGVSSKQMLESIVPVGRGALDHSLSGAAGRDLAGFGHAEGAARAPKASALSGAFAPVHAQPGANEVHDRPQKREGEKTPGNEPDRQEPAGRGLLISGVSGDEPDPGAGDEGES